MSFHLAYAPHIGFPTPDRPLFGALVGSIDPIENIAFAADQGFAGVQDPFVRSRDKDMQTRIGRELSRRGMKAASFAFTTRDNFSAPLLGSLDPAAFAIIAAEVDAAIAVAQRIGSHQIGVVGAAVPGVPLKTQHRVLEENLRRLMPRIERAGCILALEGLDGRRVPGMILNHVVDVDRIVASIDSPCVRLMFDFAHVQSMDGAILHHLDQVWPRLSVLQIANVPGRVEPDAGELNFVRLIAEIQRRGFDDLIELEHMWSRDDAETQRRGLARLREIDAAAAAYLAHERAYS